MEQMDAGIVAERLIRLRGNKSQREVADALNISASTLSMYENAERIPRDNIKIRIADYYEKTVFDIFFAPKTHVM